MDTHHRRPRSCPGPVAVILSAAVLLVACSGSGESTGTRPASAAPTSASPSQGPARPSTEPTAAASTSALESPSGVPPSIGPGAEVSLDELLALLVTAPEQRSGYDRSLFRHWIDADGDGCNTRREVLIAEAVEPPIVGGGCSLTGGRWVSAYDNLVFTDSAGLDIDHVVALGEAWDSGAYAWTPERREAFANDIDVGWALIAVSATSNRSKSDKDPADWLPPSGDDLCAFLSAWIAVKVRWELTVDEGERAAMVALIPDCGDARMPVLIAIP